MLTLHRNLNRPRNFLMPKFILSIATDNAAFNDPDDPKNSGVARGMEVARILRRLAAAVEGDSLDKGDSYPLMDVNGNRVGNARLTNR